VCYIGNTSVKAAPAIAKQAINTVINEHNRRYGAGYVRPHGAVSSTACPGSDLTAWVNAGRPGGSSQTKCQDVIMRRGSTGDKVKILQKRLNYVLNAKLVVDGDFGPKTEAAVKAFNNFFKINSLACRHVVTKKTNGFLRTLVEEKRRGIIAKVGDKKPVVKEIKGYLNKLGSHQYRRTETFGSTLEKGVIAFQKFFKMRYTDGKVDEATFGAMKHLAALADKPEPEPEPEDPPVVESVETIVSRIVAKLNSFVRRHGDEHDPEAVKQVKEIENQTDELG
jgi:peptidoglycan hydrolase-like protein with peptidoglycan-binding domain